MPDSPLQSQNADESGAPPLLFFAAIIVGVFNIIALWLFTSVFNQ